MNELRELRVYMLGVGCVAALLKIGMTIADNYNLRMGVICIENFAFDVASLLSNCFNFS